MTFYDDVVDDITEKQKGVYIDWFIFTMSSQDFTFRLVNITVGTFKMVEEAQTAAA